ncbi:MAG: N-acetyltransferase family protein [Pseudomonadota bacterium]
MVTIRRANPGDAVFIAETYRPFVDAHYVSFELTAPNADEIARRIEAAGNLYPWLIAEDDQPLAYAYASPHRTRPAYLTSVDVAIYAAENARGQGVSKRLYARLFEILTAQNYVMAFAGIVTPNDASIGVHKSLGFELVGTYPNVGFKDGAWRDTTWWGKRLAEPTTPPAKIRPVSDVI